MCVYTGYDFSNLGCVVHDSNTIHTFNTRPASGDAVASAPAYSCLTTRRPIAICAMDNRATPRPDESGEAVKSRFYTFLTSFVSEADLAISEAAPHHHRLRNTYEEQIVAMIRNDKTTVYVNFADLNSFDRELAEAVQLEYYRFERYLRQAVQDYVGAEHRDYVYDMDKGTREFFVSMHNLPRVERIRNMKTETIGRLISFSGTVTRYFEHSPRCTFLWCKAFCCVGRLRSGRSCCWGPSYAASAPRLSRASSNSARTQSHRFAPTPAALAKIFRL